MRLLNQIIQKKLELSNEFIQRRFYFRGIWNFYCVYNLACAYLGHIEDSEYSKKREVVWNKFFRYFLTKNVDDRRFREIQYFMNMDIQIIIKALRKIESSFERSDNVIGDLYKPGTIGMLAYEFESQG